MTWDWPHRLWHWSFALCVSASLATGLIGDFDLMDIHIASGVTVIGLLLFRAGWALWGGRYVRVSQYRTSVAAIWRHLRGRGRSNAAHSAPGAAMAIALFSLVMVQATSGLFSSDDIATEGPYAGRISGNAVEFATAIHTRMYWVVLGLIIVHVGAIAWYLWRRDPVALSMLHGRQRTNLPGIEDHHRMRAVVTALGAAATVYLVALLV